MGWCVWFLASSVPQLNHRPAKLRFLPVQCRSVCAAAWRQEWMDLGPREKRGGRRCLGGRNTLKLVLPSKTVLWKHSWSHGEAGETKPARLERCSFQFPMQFLHSRSAQDPYRENLKGRNSHSSAINTSDVWSHPVFTSLGFLLLLPKMSARYFLALFVLLGASTFNECWRSAAK